MLSQPLSASLAFKKSSFTSQGSPHLSEGPSLLNTVKDSSCAAAPSPAFPLNPFQISAKCFFQGTITSPESSDGLIFKLLTFLFSLSLKTDDFTVHHYVTVIYIIITLFPFNPVKVLSRLHDL